jgi:tetratricopeptide (TPR) repeat protein
MKRHPLCRWLGMSAKISLVALLTATSAGARAPMSAAGKAADERLGTVSFPVSCAPSVQADFNRGVALLHDFWYEEATPQFKRILKADPTCAMAHWGIAMSSFHQIWNRPEGATMKMGWREMTAAQAHPAKTAREREYIAALADFFRPDKRDYQTRIDAYVTALGKLYEHYPKDVDAGAFYALALMASITPTDTSLTKLQAALAVLTPLWPQYPDHPGLVHYIIHAADTPSLAPQGLAAARRYGEIAASGPHAVHMPGHIFARLGLWQEDIDSQVGSLAASDAAEAHGESGWMDQFHSDDFLAYAYLQAGQEAHAKAVIDAAAKAIAHYQSMPGMSGDNYMDGMFPDYQVKLPLFFALETRDWPAALAIEPIKDAPPYTQTQVYWGRVIAAGHLHKAQQAKSDLAAYDELMKKSYDNGSTGAQVGRGEMLAWIACADGNIAEAVRQMRESADLQDKVGQGEVDIPAREMLGDILLESGQPREALIEYKQDLKLSPNRFNGLFNAGKAAEAAGATAEARGYYAALLKSTDNGAESARAEIQHAKDFVATASLGVKNP